MSNARKSDDLQVGSVLAGPVRSATLRRVKWYEESMRFAGDAKETTAPPNIHSSYEIAREQGMKAPIFDGMATTHWCSSMLIEYFGLDYVERGELRTKYIKPTYIDELVKVKGRVISIEARPDGSRLFTLDVWSEDGAGLKLTDGHAKIEVRS